MCAAYSASVKLIQREVCFSSIGCNEKHSQFSISKQNPAIFLSDIVGMDFEDLIFMTDTGKLRAKTTNEMKGLFVCWLLNVPATG